MRLLKLNRPAEFHLLRWTAFSPVVVLALVTADMIVPLRVDDFDKLSVHSMRVMDCHGVPLRELLNDRQGRGQWKPLDQISPLLVEATIAVEDRRFYRHSGIDAVAIGRALMQNIGAERVESGASTLTQQVIRNVRRRPRSLWNKALEACNALRLERHFTKEELLEQYLNRAPYGNQLSGAEAASRCYFRKPALDLSLAEAAFLAALPNAPTTLNPYRNFEAAQKRKRAVLARMRNQKRITEDEYRRALIQPLRLTPPDINFRAPHAVDMAVERTKSYPGAVEVRTTIDYALQRTLAVLVRNDIAKLAEKKVTNAAVVVIENKTGAIRALIGSADYFDAEHDGQVNGATALRQPGSAIKPFTYGLAFESGFSPADVIADIPTRIPDHHGDYVPENYDRRYHGPVRVRTALACSYNVPAVRVLQAVGKERYLQKLRLAGLTSIDQSAEHYGLGITLGNADVTLLELTNAYTALANGGLWKPAKLVEGFTFMGGSFQVLPDTVGTRRIFDETAAFLVTDILADAAAKRPAFGNVFRFPFQCAVKTGTTKNFRDNWTLGYTTDYTVGVWAGNFDGTPMRGVSGVTGAGAIFIDVMTALHDPSTRRMPADFPIPEGLERCEICVRSGKLPNGACVNTMTEWFFKDHSPKETCKVHRNYLVQNPDGNLEERVFESFPAEFRTWAMEQKIPSPPPEAVLVRKRSSNLSMNPSRRNRLDILSPTDGDYFKMDPILRKEYQTIKVVGVVSDNIKDVILRVDSDETLPYNPEGTWWTLEKGGHRIRLEGKSGDRIVSSQSVQIEVD